MNILVYDVEVFKEDWIVVFKPVDGGEHIVIHNDNNALRRTILDTPNLLLCGFNSKHYDDAIIHAIMHGADNRIVKQLNDHIIESKKMWWEFPFLNYKKKEFQSFDLRDDLPINLSLKAIEGNLGQSIVESNVDFRIDRKLTQAELSESIAYCKVDVDNTFLLYKTRANYIDSKKTVAKLKGMDEALAMTMTNAKLTAYFLDAKKTRYTDEMEYTPPKELQLGKYERVLQFFLDPVQYSIYQLNKELETETRKSRIGVIKRRIAKIEKGDRYDCKLDTAISDVPHTFAWGGIHGAIPNYVQYEQPGYKMVTIDVGSYYPSMMLEYDYISRSIPSSEGFADIYRTRMKAKATGDKATSNALKLVLNTCYGAMKNQYNDLYDPRNASAICITGQLLLTDLIDKLEDVPGFELIQSNTDGLMIRYPVEHDDLIVERVTEWEQRTRMNMEYTDIHAIAQKDVNNYVMSSGEVYYYQDGKKVVAEPDERKVQLKGGYVSLAKGGTFENNSMVIVQQALVEYFINRVPVSKTINACDTIEHFQIIAKTGSTYQGTYHDVDGRHVDVQNVNRVYATSNKKYGTVYKRKKDGSADKIANLPDHCYIDNEGHITLDDIDKSFYIELAEKRVLDYTGGSKLTTQTKTFGRAAYYYHTPTDTYIEYSKGDEQPSDDYLAECKKITKAEYVKGIKQDQNTTQSEDLPMEKLNLYQKINKVRLEFLKANPKKTGVNRFAEYKYFELADIVPVAMALCDKYGITPLISFSEEYATMNVVDTEVNDEGQHQAYEFQSPMRKLAVKGMNEIQALGGVETYQRRYLYMMFLDIVEADAFDATNGKDEPQAETKAAPKPTVKAAAPKTSNKPATQSERKEVKEELTATDDAMTTTQETAIKNGLKKLREIDRDTHEPFIIKVMSRVKKGGVTKKDAEDALLAISSRIQGGA